MIQDVKIIMEVLMKEIDEDNNSMIVASEFNYFLANKWDKNWKNYLR